MIPRFYLGTHRPNWLWIDTPPLMISRRQLASRSTANLTPGVGRWALDSGGFTELSMHGKWTLDTWEYVEQVRTWDGRIGGLDWAAPQDWMCEPAVIEGGAFAGQSFAGTGLSVREHQERTVANFLELRALAPELPFIPVVQGFTIAEYLRCVELYRGAGVDLAAEPLVGVGSVCRRQSTGEIHDVFAALHQTGVRMHGFGVKSGGLRLYGRYLTSADSLAWSYRARKIAEPLAECVGRGHKNCANCLTFARRWYGEREAELVTQAMLRRTY